MYERRLFSAMVTGLDIAIGRVVEALREKGLYDNSIILFSSDNGGLSRSCTRLCGSGSGGSGGNNYPLRGEKNTIWEGGTRVPAFIHSPLIENRRNIYKGLIHVTDWFPTLYSAAGGNVKDLGLVDGINQWDTIKVQGPSKRTEMLYNSNPLGAQSPTGSAIRFGDMKLIMGEPGPGFIVEPGGYPNDSLSGNADNIKLYDLASDPSESDNVASRYPDLVSEMMRRLAELEGTALPPFTGPDILAGNPNLNGGFFGTGWCDKP